MKVFEVRMVVACCYETANQMQEILSSDDFAEEVRKIMAHMADPSTEEYGVNDITIQIDAKDIKEVYNDRNEDRDNEIAEEEIAQEGKEKDAKQDA